MTRRARARRGVALLLRRLELGRQRAHEREALGGRAHGGGAAGTSLPDPELQEEPPEEPPEVSREESSEERGARGAGYRRGDGGVVGEGGPLPLLPLPRGGNAPGESRGSALGEAGASGGDRDASQDASGSSRSPALMILMRTMARRARREH